VKSIELSFALLAGVVGSGSACDLCSSYSATQAQDRSGPGPFAGAAEQFTHMATVQVDGHEVPNEADQHLESSITQVFAGYQFSDRAGLQFNLPLIYRSFKRPDGLGGIERGTESGLGDVSLLGSLALYSDMGKRSTVRLDLLAGVKFPTGNTHRLAEEFHEIENPIGPPSGIHGHDLTRGSGSYDGLVGGSAFAGSGRWFVAGTLQYAVRSEGDYSYRFANDLTWTGGPGAFLLSREDLTLSLQAVVSGEHKGLDTFQGAAAEDTGLTSVYLGPQLNLTWSGKLSAQVGVDLPVSIHNSSLQVVADCRVRAGLTWRF
jgi:hypothetical protein